MNEGDLVLLGALLAQRVSRSARCTALLPVGACRCLLLLQLPANVGMYRCLHGICSARLVLEVPALLQVIFHKQKTPLRIRSLFSSPNMRMSKTVRVRIYLWRTSLINKEIRGDALLKRV